METKTVKIGKNEFLFINSWKNTRNGFAHITELHHGGRCISEAKVNYLNRTWESYTYQTSMMQAVENAIAQREYDLIEEFKSSKGITRTTKAQKELACNGDARLELLNKLYKEL